MNPQMRLLGRSNLQGKFLFIFFQSLVGGLIIALPIILILIISSLGLVLGSNGVLNQARKVKYESSNYYNASDNYTNYNDNYYDEDFDYDNYDSNYYDYDNYDSNYYYYDNYDSDYYDYDNYNSDYYDYDNFNSDYEKDSFSSKNANKPYTLSDDNNTLSVFALASLLGLLLGLIIYLAFIVIELLVALPVLFGLSYCKYQLYNNNSVRFFEFVTYGFKNAVKSYKLFIRVFLQLLVPNLILSISTRLLGHYYSISYRGGSVVFF